MKVTVDMCKQALASYVKENPGIMLAALQKCAARSEPVNCFVRNNPGSLEKEIIKAKALDYETPFHNPKRWSQAFAMRFKDGTYHREFAFKDFRGYFLTAFVNEKDGILTCVIDDIDDSTRPLYNSEKLK